MLIVRVRRGKMPVYWTPYTFQEQLETIQGLKELGLDPKVLERLELMEKHLTDYGFLTDDEIKYLQNVLDEHGWRLE